MDREQVFDLIAQPDLIHPPYGFIAIFAFAGLVLIAVACLSWRFKWRNRKFLALFAPVWVVLVIWLSTLDAIDVWHIRDKVKARDYTNIEGCLDYFHPGDAVPSKGTDGNERWRLGGHDFSYGSGEARPGYHAVATAGGIVHADSRLSVSFVRSDYYGRMEIVRIKAVPHACPTAPDRGV